MVKGNKVLSAFLAALLLFTMQSTAWAVDQAAIAEKQAELQDVQGKLYQKEVERDKQKQQVTSAIDKYREAQKELNAARMELQKVVDEEAKVMGEIEDKKKSILSKKAELMATKKDYGKRLREIYISGQVNYLDVLLGAKDFNDFSTRMYLLERIVSKDIDMMDRLMEQQEDLEQEQRNLEETQKKLDDVKKEREAKKKIVQEKTDAAQAVYEKALAEQNRLDEEYTELEYISQRITRMIRVLERGGKLGSVVGTGELDWPVHGVITSEFGWRIHPIFGTRKYHSGMDISCDEGEAIRAADSGIVITADWMGGYGYTVMIDHGRGLVTLYAHNSALCVSEGDSVEQGEVIARGGSTGYATGPHCHFEVRKNGAETDPADYLP